MTITDGDVVSLEYTGRLDDGTVFETSRREVAEETGVIEEQPGREYDPLTVEVGDSDVIDGLEEALYDLEEGTTTTVTIPPASAYGEWSEADVQEISASEFDEMIGDQDAQEGAFIQTQIGLGEIVDIGDEVVTLDFNHQLAGETLEFEIEILDVDSS
ncbi:FKBP-type peptidyl-prolyl cis-trans isomerase [Halomicroarcula sp. F13]|uniref:Peptidyl-prolyl cis-trans isomerase n=1 Tax=Haloarcula rubra TaxID=2487747 RepID=A0AAW4PWD7_9EURY|nr:FKBP-type peptidyl-prolyl cis-trans isomerase [Halomicroarcula rubra]MBX0326033.1 FKBP-type peptidyl-prolyl cis-trans isomerase [Halomicroarcula rubra]